MRLVRRGVHSRGGVGEGVLIRHPALLESIAEGVGTPTYVYDAGEILRRYRQVESTFQDIPHRVHYSVKANGNLAVLQLLCSAGAGADIVSVGELNRVRLAGFASESVVYSGVGKRMDELEAALESRVGLINVESVAELDLLDELAVRMGVVQRVGIRVNPDVRTDTHPYHQTGAAGMKFGVPLDEAADLAASVTRREGVKLGSVAMHIGSQILDPSRYAAGAQTLSGLIREVRLRGVDTLDSVGLGGGWGVRYRDETPLAVEAVAEVARRLHEETTLPVLLEPGRFLVASAGLLLTRCLYRKHSGGRDFAVVDAGMNDLLRPSLYGSYHEIAVVDGGNGALRGEVSADDRSEAHCVTDVVGPLCESGDFLGLERAIGVVAPGTLLAVLDTGAYGFSMTSNYNSRPRPAEVIVHGDRWAVIRERETSGDLVRGERTMRDVEADAAWMEVHRV